MESIVPLHRPPGLASGAGSRLVDRDDELSTVARALDALEQGRGSCLFVVGEPGIGKTRLAAEAAAEADRRGVVVLAGRATPTGAGLPYQSLSAALLHGLRSRPDFDLSQARGVRAGLATLLPGLFDGPALPPSPVLVGETVLRVAQLLGGESGTLLVLDDLQWACGDTLAVTEYLADHAAHARVVVLGTARPEGAADGPIDALERRRSAKVVTLARLGRRAVGQMISARLSDSERRPPDAVVELLNARAEGLPFLVEELLTDIVSRGALVAGDDGWELAGDVRTEVPMSFAQAVRERLAALPEQRRHVVKTAAILGRDFDWSHLPMLSRTGESEVLEALSSAVELHLVEEVGGDRFRFRHALTVDAILGQMLDPQRERLAARALDDLMEGPKEVGVELLELAAHLAAQAGRKAEAAQLLSQSARRALATGAVATAAATARRARDAAPGGDAAATEAGEVLLAALSVAGDAHAAQQLGGELLSELEGTGAPADQRATVMLLLARSAHTALDLARAGRLCDEALAMDPQSAQLRLELDLTRAELAFSEHEYVRAAAAAEAVLARAERCGFDEVVCDALHLLGRHRAQAALDSVQAQRYFVSSLKRAERADLPFCRLRALLQLAYFNLGSSADLELLTEARGAAEQLGALALTAELDQVAALGMLAEDKLDGARALADRALEAARSHGLGELAAVISGTQATIEAVAGRREDAERQVEMALAQAPPGVMLMAAIGGLPLLLAALADDDLPAAARRVAETRALMPMGEMVFHPLELGIFYGVAAVVHTATGASELVHGRDWVPVDDTLVSSSFDVARAIVAGRAGEAERAAALFAAADGKLGGAPWLRAVYRRCAAQAALTDGWGDPAAWLTGAEQYFEATGREPLARACRSLLRLAGKSPRRSTGTSDGARFGDLELTTRERDVLALLAEGMTNKQIAARLYLSPRTVEKHVERILTKTGQVNRTALAAHATARRPSVPAIEHGLPARGAHANDRVRRRSGQRAQ